MILVTGATGYLGNLLVKALAKKGNRVRGLVVKGDPLLDRIAGTGCEIVEGDITSAATLGPAFQGVRTVIHLAAVMVSHNKELFFRINYDGTKNVVEAAVKAGVEHFIYISAAAANYRIRTDYGITKAEAEKLMVKRGKTNFTIIRPTLIYGDNGGQEFTMYLEAMKKFPLIIPLVGDGGARKRMVWVHDIIDGLCRCVGSPVTYGKIYNFSGGSEESMREITKMLRDRFGIRKPVVRVPLSLVRLIAFVLKIVSKTPMLNRNTILGVIMDANGSPESARRDIGYTPVPFRDGLAREYPHTAPRG